MLNEVAQKMIADLQKDLEKNGIVADTMAAKLKDLRPFAIEEEDPTLTKVIRLTYEHLDKNGSFNIPIPGEIQEDEEGNEIEIPSDGQDNIEEDFEQKRASFAYLLEIFLDNQNKYNRTDLMAYRDRLMEYSS